MSDIETRLRNVQTKHSQATAARARSEVERDNAAATRDKVKESLKTEFGIVTSEDLKRVHAELTEQVETAVAEAEAQLEAAGATTA